MSDNINTPFGWIATKDDAGVHFQKVLLEALINGGAGARYSLIGSIANGLMVDVTRVLGSVAVTHGGLTDIQLRAAALSVLRVKTPLTPSAPTFATVGVASGEIVAANAARKGLSLVNTSANWIYLAFAAAAVAGSGIALAPNGGAFNMGEFDFNTSAVRAIASAAASDIGIQEFI